MRPPVPERLYNECRTKIREYSGQIYKEGYLQMQRDDMEARHSMLSEDGANLVQHNDTASSLPESLMEQSGTTNVRYLMDTNLLY